MHRFRRSPGRTWLAAGLVVSVVLAGSFMRPTAARAAVGIPPDNPCLTAPEDINHSNIRLDEPAEGARVPVDAQGKITVSGVLHKQATMDDVTVGSLVTTAFTFGPPPDGVSQWAVSWTTSVRPPHLGPIQLCARAERDPKWQARILRNVTVVDLIPPSDVPNLSVVDITATSAKVTWGAATDNYGLAGYEVRVDGGTATRATVGTRTYSITGLSPSTDHTVSVVAVDLAGNRSVTPAITSFTTTAAPPPPNPDTDLVIDAHESYATVTWHPDLPGDARYIALLDGVQVEGFPLDLYCQDASGNPANPCTAQDMIRYPLGAQLDEGTPYTIQIQALGADGTQSRELSATFTTLTIPPLVPEATVALIASDSSRCAAMGGSFYASPSVRGQVPVPAGSTLVFEGCYRVANSSCIDAFLPPSGNKVIKCVDDITNLLYSIAPPGRGPVISSMEGTTAGIAPAFVPNPVMEPVNWCVEEPIVCVEVIETAAEAGAVVAEAAGAAALASFLVVAATGIGLGLALGVLLALLFPTPAAIGSLIEYPIDFNTDFDTFDNWGQGEGHWMNTLKTYAEVIKTTKQVAAEHGLPFAWNNTNDNDLKTAIDLACGAAAGRPPNEGNVCGDNLTVYVPGGKSYLGGPMKETGTHIVDALGNGIPNPQGRSAWFYPAFSPNGKAATSPPFNYKRDWYDTNPAFNQNVCNPRPAGKPVCDEFPFFSTNQAVNLSGITASLRPVPKEEQFPQFQDLGGFYSQCRVHEGDHFIVLPARSWVEAGGPSFAFQVNQGGASLCLKPRTP